MKRRDESQSTASTQATTTSIILTHKKLTRMVPEYHPVFADTRLVYRVITLETGLGNLQDLQEDQWATIANLCDRVEEKTGSGTTGNHQRPNR